MKRIIIIMSIFALILVSGCNIDNNIDNNEISLCEKYAELNKVNISYMNNKEYIYIDNKHIEYDQIKKSCLGK